MSTFSQAILPGLGLTGIVLTGALTTVNATRDQAELETAQAALVAVESQLEEAEATIGELRQAGADLTALKGQLEEAEAAIEELQAALKDGTPVEPVAEAEPEEPEANQVAEAGNAEAGAKLFSQCRSCHQVGAGAENSVGPHLNLLFGRKAASIEGFKYSDSLVRAASNGLEWHADTLSSYIEDPRTFASGTRMSYAGMKDAGDREDLLAYLRTFSDNPQDIPEADPTFVGTDHEVDPEILALKGDPEYGEYLSSECTTCHQPSGADNGIPSIVLWPEEAFVTAMHAYKDKVRPNEVMQLIAGRLSNDEIAALAAYFKDLEP